MSRTLFPVLVLLIFAGSSSLWSQATPDTVNDLQAKALKVFLDCSACDQDYIRTEITFVNYVRDPKEADVHVLETDQSTASGGREYTMTLIGQGSYSGMVDTLLYVSKHSDTDAAIRSGIVRVLRNGLLRYAMHTPLAEYLTVNYQKATAAKEVTDKWDYWVFTASISSFANGEQQHKSTQLFGGFSANRITKEWKISLSLNPSYSEDIYHFNDTTSITNIRRSQSFNGLVVRSIDDHWSAGLSAGASASTYGNNKNSFSLAPALEYDIFPYSQSTREQLRFTYKMGYSTASYLEETIFDKTSESYVVQSLDIALELKQQWGTISTTLSGRQYPGDFRNAGKSLREQISWSLFGAVSWRVFEGLSFTLAGDYSEIHDQFSLLKRGLSSEDVLLQRSQLATNYSYFFSVGLSYTFGSIFNNIVNPRMGSTSGGGGISIMISS